MVLAEGARDAATSGAMPSQTNEGRTGESMGGARGGVLLLRSGRSVVEMATPTMCTSTRRQIPSLTRRHGRQYDIIG